MWTISEDKRHKIVFRYWRNNAFMWRYRTYDFLFYDFVDEQRVQDKIKDIKEEIKIQGQYKQCKVWHWRALMKLRNFLNPWNYARPNRQHASPFK